MRVTMEENARWVYLVLLNILVMVGTAYAGKGIIRCDCTTQECIDAGKTMCVAQKACYTELYENKLTRGCDPNGLACENRRPSGLEDLEWPTLYCCKDRDMCNKHVIPEIPGKTEKNSKTPPFLEEPLPHSDDNDDNTTNDKNGNDNNSNSNNKNNKNPQQQQADSELCPHNHGKSASSSSSSSSSTSSSNPSSVPQPKTKIINPIYIAVPVAGVCVLLALIIFAMYLLRRRTVYHHGHHHHGHHHHENFHHYHHQHDHHVPELSPHPKQTTGMPPNHPYHPHHPNHHHCQCVCKKQTSSLPACSKSNRCTESERSSSGSETKLFLQT